MNDDMNMEKNENGQVFSFLFFVMLNVPSQ